MNSQAAEWKADDPGLQAAFEYFQRMEKKDAGDFCDTLNRHALDDYYRGNSPGDKQNRASLARLLDAWMKKLPDGAHRAALQLLWMRSADLSDEKLREYLANENFEVRRMALVLLFRAQTKGPEDLIKKFISDPSAELRAMAVAAAIPAGWRQALNDPTGYDLIAGERAHTYYQYSDMDLAKVPKVVELPVETLEKLLKDDDESVRMITAFLMAMEGGDQGIPVLLRAAKGGSNRREGAKVLLYAVVMAWSDDLTPQLAEAAKVAQSNRAGNELRRIWQFIVKLQGTEIKALRAKLKKEIPELSE